MPIMIGKRTSERERWNWTILFVLFSFYFSLFSLTLSISICFFLILLFKEEKKRRSKIREKRIIVMMTKKWWHEYEHINKYKLKHKGYKEIDRHIHPMINCLIIRKIAKIQYGFFFSRLYTVILIVSDLDYRTLNLFIW